MSGTAYVIEQLGQALENSHAALGQQQTQIAALRSQNAALEAEVERLRQAPPDGSAGVPAAVPVSPTGGAGNTGIGVHTAASVTAP